MDELDPIQLAHQLAKAFWSKGWVGGVNTNFPNHPSFNIPWRGYWMIYGPVITMRMAWEK